MPHVQPKVDLTDAWISKYHFRKRLGRGGYGEVWLADETAPNRDLIRTVAVKVFWDYSDDRESFTKTFDDFQIDLKFLADLAPGNPIVQYYNSEMIELFIDLRGTPRTVGSRTGDDAVDADRPLTAFLIVMEFADGGSLENNPNYEADVLQSGDRTIYLTHFIDICTGLMAAHDKGVIHRDIKPSNFMWFKKANRVKIGDFGIAKQLGELPVSARGGLIVTGTPAYMSPESFDATVQATPERDIYALGCSFYELLTGHQAFNPFQNTMRPNDQREQLDMWRIKHETALRPETATRAPGLVSVELSSMIRRMMSIAPSDRPKLQQVVDALQSAKPHTIDSDTIARAMSASNIPSHPVRHSRYNVSPAFRRALEQQVYFVFLSFPAHTPYKTNRLHAYLRTMFLNTFSAFEIFGKYDYVIRFSSTRTTADAFCNRVVNEILDNDRSALRIMCCDEFSHIGSTENEWSSESTMEALIELHKAQSHDRRGTEAEAANKWLVRNGVYVRQIQENLKPAAVHAFCLISTPHNASQTEKRAAFAILKNALSSSPAGDRNWCTSLYHKSYQLVERFENEPSEFIISYIAPAYDRVIDVPGLIVGGLADFRMQPVSLLATHRIYIDSDGVMLP